MSDEAKDVTVIPCDPLEHLMDIDLKTISSVALARLVNEVQMDGTAGVTHFYDRFHNRYNRY